MTRTKYWWVLILVVALAACGGGGDEGPGGGDGGDAIGANSGADQADNAAATGELPDIDPSAMPAPGEARVDVDGQTFVFRQADMIEGVFACEIRDNGITINFQSDRHDLLLQGATQADASIIASTTVVPEDWDFRYDSTTAGGNLGGVAVEAPYVLYVSRFDATPKDDLASFADVGTGTVAVTCP